MLFRSASDFTVTNGTVSSVSGSGTTWTVNVTPTTNIASGNITMVLQAGAVQDTAGNPNAQDTNAAQAIDTRAPTRTTSLNVAFTDSGTSVSDRITNDNTMDFSGTASANFVTGDTVRIYDGPTLLATVTPTVGGTGWSLSGVTVTNGSHTFTARVAESSGNEGTASTATTAVTVDTVSPTVTVTDNVAGTANVATGTVNYTYTFNEDRKSTRLNSSH
mgnify:CR=1 FL=1